MSWKSNLGPNWTWNKQSANLFRSDRGDGGCSICEAEPDWWCDGVVHKRYSRWLNHHHDRSFQIHDQMAQEKIRMPRIEFTWEQAELLYPGCSAAWDRDCIEPDQPIALRLMTFTTPSYLVADDLTCKSTAVVCTCMRWMETEERWKPR